MRKLLNVAWDYPVHRQAGADRVAEGVSAAKGARDALLSTRFDNERTLLLAHWFHMVKLPTHVADQQHPFRNLFGEDPPHLFVATRDLETVIELDGGQSQKDLWRAMHKMLDVVYEKDADRAYKKVLKLLDKLDDLDAQENQLLLNLDSVTEKEGPRSFKARQLQRRIEALDEERETVRAKRAQLMDLAPPGQAQKRSEPERWRLDPYTRNDPEAMHAAGYVSYAPFVWADGVRTAEVEDVLGDVQMLWVETEHFRIGSGLPEYRVLSEEKKKVKAELKRLYKRLPRIKTGARHLDPWLRLHLWAQRAEEHYAEFRSMLGLSDADFPDKPGDMTRHGYMGEGPYLGQPDKYLLLLFAKASDLGRYAGRYTKRKATQSLRHTFPRDRGLLYATTSERITTQAEIRLRTDTELHCNVVFSLTHNLVNGFKYFAFSVPLWLPEGLAHYYARRVCERFNNYTQVKETGSDLILEWEWRPKVYKRVKRNYFPAAQDLMAWTNWMGLSFADQMMLWSRVDCLMQESPQKVGALLSALKARESGAEVLTDKQMLAAQAAALEEQFGLDHASFDQRWRKYVLKEYR